MSISKCSDTEREALAHAEAVLFDKRRRLEAAIHEQQVLTKEIANDEEHVWRLVKAVSGRTDDCQICGKLFGRYPCHLCKRRICNRCVVDEEGRDDDGYGFLEYTCTDEDECQRIYRKLKEEARRTRPRLG